MKGEEKRFTEEEVYLLIRDLEEAKADEEEAIGRKQLAMELLERFMADKDEAKVEGYIIKNVTVTEEVFDSSLMRLKNPRLSQNFISTVTRKKIIIE